MARTWRRPLLVLAAAGVAVALLGPAGQATAQLDPGNFDIRQHGAVVGHIFVPPHRSPDVYVEHWVVSGDYVYPSPQAPVTTEIVPSTRRFADEADFFRQVDFGPASRYIRVLARESGALPTPGALRTGASQNANALPLNQAMVGPVAAGGSLALFLAVRGRGFRARGGTS